MRIFPRRLTTAMTLALAVFYGSTGHAQSSTPPPLQATEAIVKTKDGCGFVVAAEAAKYMEKVVAASEWGGTCVEGLAMGASPGPGATVWMHWGRRFGLESNTYNGKQFERFYWGDKSVEVPELADDGAHWPAEQKSYDDAPVVYRMFKDVEGNLIFSQKVSCILADVVGAGSALRGCKIKKPFGIFRIETRLKGPGGSTTKSVLCPDPRTPKGCDALWAQLAGPFFERSRSFVADNTPKVEALKREMPTLIAEAQAAALVAAQQREAAAQRKAAEAKRESAAAAAEAARLAELKDAEERQFRQLLAQSGPGQLFTLADRLSSEGKPDQAREARRALISRFPDHALAATAATQLANGGSAGSRTTAVSSAASSTGSRGNAGPTGATQSATESCAPDPSLMADYVRYRNAFYARTGGMAPGAVRVSRTSPDEANKMFVDFKNGLLDQDEHALKRFISHHEMIASQPIGSFPAYMDGASQQTAARIYIQMGNCVLGQKAAPAGTPARAAPAGGNNAACVATPQESLRNFNGELQNFANRHPNKSDAGGSRDQYQYMFFYGTSALPILEKYRDCMAPADYQANKKALEDARDVALQGCERLSSSLGTCTPTYPANWR
jgi:hypothetical protein